MGSVLPMCLDIDAGNTRIKWRLLENGNLLSSGAVTNVSTELRASLVPYFSRIERCRLSSVAGLVTDAEIGSLIKRECGVVLEEARAAQSSCGVENAYEPPESLGVDRWLAVVAAYGRYGKACVVIDCGSAVTVDLLGNGGRYFGGYIVPGLGLMRRSLFQDTDAVKVESAPVSDLSAGRNTANAVNRGLLHMLLGLLDRAQVELGKLDAHAEPVIVITGGDALQLKPYLPDTVQFCEGLVFEGLAKVLP